jgi:hypothetical protein
VRQIVDRIDRQRHIRGNDLLTLALATEFGGGDTGARHALFKAIVLTAGGMHMNRKGPVGTYVPRR